MKNLQSLKKHIFLTYYEVINTFDLVFYEMSVEYFPVTFLPSSTSEPRVIYFVFKKSYIEDNENKL